MKLDADMFIAQSLARMTSKEADTALEAYHVAAERERLRERARWIDAFTMRVGALVPQVKPQEAAARATRLFETVGYLDPLRAALEETRGSLPAD